MVVALGCSGNGGSPVSPNAGPAITGSDLSGQSLGPNTYLAGYYECYLDIPTQTLEVVADRTANFTLNIIPFLNQMKDPGMGIKFGSLGVNTDDPDVLKVDVEFQWYHPFPTLDQYKAYDMMGVIISNGDTTLGYESPAGNPLTVGQHGTDTYMTNADGYTRWFNPTEFTTTLIFGWAPGGIQNLAGDALLNPYKAYGMGLGPEDDLWGWLTGGSNNDGLWESGAGRMMNLEFPAATAGGDGLTFAYAAVVCWEEQGSDPPGGYTPYHRDEPIACSVNVTDNVYFDGTTTGGNLILDADLWAWGAQPSTVKVESTVLSAVADMGPGATGGDNYSTYHLDIPADVALVTTGGQEFWIIAECGAFGYKPVTELGEVLDIPSADGVLASFFRFPLYVSPTPYCSLEVDSIAPTSAATGSTLTGATITCDVISAPGLKAALKLGATTIDATNVAFVNSTTLTCDFNLTTAALGVYDVWVGDDACPTGGTLVDGFEVILTPPGWDIDITGNLPTPYPTNNGKDFTIVSSGAKRGVYYHYSTGPTNYMLYKYALDYTGTGSFNCNITDPYGGTDSWYISPQDIGSLAMTINGAFSLHGTNHTTDPTNLYGMPGDNCPGIYNSSGNAQNIFFGWSNSFTLDSALCDIDIGWDTTAGMWAWWNNPSHDGMYFGDMVRFESPYGPFDYTEFPGYVGYDPIGGNDGFVDDTYARRMAIDDDPQGLEAPYDIIHYYIENNNPSYPTDIEAMQNSKQFAFPTALYTYHTFAGEPVDITVYNAFGYIDGSAGNWLVVLEDNGGTWQIESFDTAGNVTGVSDTINGTPLTTDNDITNHKIHVWYNDGGLKYAVFIYQ